MYKPRLLNFRVSDSSKQIIEMAAEHRNLPASEYIRNIVEPFAKLDLHHTAITVEDFNTLARLAAMQGGKLDITDTLSLLSKKKGRVS
jgi:uncharacterized protein (DUF1778 family)